MSLSGQSFPHGVIAVVQTPFSTSQAVDHDSLARLVEHAIEGGADGLLAPVVASEVGALDDRERHEVVAAVRAAAAGRVPVIVGASDDDAARCRAHLAAAADLRGGYLVAVPQRLYGDPAAVHEFFAAVSYGIDAPLLVQDLRWSGPGLALEVVESLVERVPAVAGVKVETVPSGPAYSGLLDRFEGQLFVCGGWAVAQLVEALDRGVHAIVPESSMVPVYRAIIDLHRAGRRDEAVALFRRLLPVLAYTNQDLYTSIAFFKRLLVRKGVLATDTLRQPGFTWDRYNLRIADELIALYLDLEQDVRAVRPRPVR